MIRVEVAKKGSVKVELFDLQAFLAQNAASKIEKKVSKKALKKIAEDLQLAYDESQITFAKKLINAYLKS